MAKVLLLGRALAVFGGLANNKVEFFSAFGGLFFGEVDAVVVGDVLDGFGREFAGSGGDSHGGEDGTTGCQVTAEGS